MEKFVEFAEEEHEEQKQKSIFEVGWWVKNVKKKAKEFFLGGFVVVKLN